MSNRSALHRDFRLQAAGARDPDHSVPKTAARVKPRALWRGLSDRPDGVGAPRRSIRAGLTLLYACFLRSWAVHNPVTCPGKGR